MALPDFKKTEQNKNAVPEWSQYMKDDEFISYATTYISKQYFNLFDKYVYECAETGDIRYYVYDPVKHGADPSGEYPVLMWFHGASNSLMEEGCIMCCGAEQFASPKYQNKMGGAYLIVPLANEKRLDDGSISGTWNDNYLNPIKAIYDKVCYEHADNIGKKFVIGASSGGYFTWRLIENYIGYFDAAMPIASFYLPPDDKLNQISESGIEILIAHGQRDEMADFDKCILPRLDKLVNLKNVICFFPEWVYNGDAGIASVFYGFEMGQHCMINWVQNDLMFDNGIPADEKLPEGVTGWVKKISQGKK